MGPEASSGNMLRPVCHPWGSMTSYENSLSSVLTLQSSESPGDKQQINSFFTCTRAWHFEEVGDEFLTCQDRENQVKTLQPALFRCVPACPILSIHLGKGYPQFTHGLSHSLLEPGLSRIFQDLAPAIEVYILISDQIFFWWFLGRAWPSSASPGTTLDFQ